MVRPPVRGDNPRALDAPGLPDLTRFARRW
jgi:hypothetical protein